MERISNTTDNMVGERRSNTYDDGVERISNTTDGGVERISDTTDGMVGERGSNTYDGGVERISNTTDGGVERISNTTDDGVERISNTTNGMVGEYGTGALPSELVRKIKPMTPIRKNLSKLKENVKMKTLLFEEKVRNVTPDCGNIKLQKKLVVKTIRTFKTDRKTRTSTTGKEKTTYKEDNIPEDDLPSPELKKVRIVKESVGESPGQFIKLKSAHARGEGVKKRKKLDDTAIILKLRKIKKYFTPVHTGDREKREKEEKEKQTLNLPVSCATSKLGWGG